ncbi:GTP:AMP phosphotransferase AK3, mitochondrial [Anthonomus grandis grandis]|uniref:GTP:AMP phosphotransferase AK3, mitochondrial n=1 Tax=Anthonomus grandis grandis TaxID=2921223 RepID=UPI00216561A7|nr:GTP:AMP phosphotransferase AK3, mitochondrial [Anthonomus grandis grandis]
MMASKFFKSVILGPPGSGKGTISARIVNTFNLEHVSSGDRLRQNIKERTSIGLEAEKYIKGGKLVPDDVMIKFICEDLKQTKSGWLLDGFPRTEAQAQALWEIHKLDIALNLVVPYSVIIDRIKDRWVHLPSGRVYNQGSASFNPPKIRGKDDVTGEPLVQRDDDKPEVIKKRLELYDQMTKPVIEFYRRKGILHEFTGNTSDEIWPKVLDCLVAYIPLQITKRA